MSSTKYLAALLALGVAGNAAAEPKGEVNRGLDSVNQPVVQRTDYVLDLGTEQDRLSGAEQHRLSAWFTSLGLGYGDRVSIDGYDGGGGARYDIASVAAHYGLLLSEGAPVLGGTIEPGMVRVIVSRSTASVPSCPNWSTAGGASSTSPNYGCAVNSNLAAMIADPSDLVLGQSGDMSRDANTASKAIRVYRETAPTGTKGLTKTTTTGGN